jgi:RNA polymerase sigma-70 factor (ECF subfamily)
MQPDEAFVQNIAACQNRLLAYIVTNVTDTEASRDILQEVNLVLWRRKDQFESGTNFNAWAYKIAFYQVLAWRRDKGRDRHVFDEDLMMMIADEAVDEADGFDIRLAALRGCLAQLEDKQRWLIEQRYNSNVSVNAIAEMMGRKSGAVATMIYRIRNSLRTCIAVRINSEGA